MLLDLFRGKKQGRCKGRRRRQRRMRSCMQTRIQTQVVQPKFKELPKSDEKVQEIYTLLPKKNCGACGFDSCYECALMIATNNAPPDACKIVGKKIKSEVERILQKGN